MSSSGAGGLKLDGQKRFHNRRKEKSWPPASAYREFLGDDLDDALKVAEGELLTSAVAEFESRAHRDEVMDRVMKDPRVTDMVGGEQIADMSRMRYGGFQAFVNS